jgi:hypothetical protein
MHARIPVLMILRQPIGGGSILKPCLNVGKLLHGNHGKIPYGGNMAILELSDEQAC